MDDLQDKKKYETEIYQEWIDQGCFKPSYNFDKNFSICIPPLTLQVLCIWAML